MELENWTQLVRPDMEELAELIIRAKGPDRTMAEFAAVVGTSASTLSRAINNKATRPLSDELLLGIAENAQPESKVGLEELLYANGYRRKRNRVVQGDNDIADKHHRRTKIQKFLTEKVLQAGASVSLEKKYGDEDPLLEKYGLDFGIPMRFEMIMRTDLFEGKELWVVMPLPYVCKNEDGSDAVDVVSLILKNMSDILLVDRWRPALLAKVRYTIAIADELIYFQFLQALKDLNAKVNNCFTVMLVDLEEQEVVEEKVVPGDGENQTQTWFDVMDKKE